MTARSCAVCGRRFDPGRPALTCGPACRRARHRETDRARRAADPEGERERARRRYRADPERFRGEQRSWRAANPERARRIGREAARRRRAARPERERAYRREYSRRRRAAARAASGGRRR